MSKDKNQGPAPVIQIRKKRNGHGGGHGGGAWKVAYADFVTAMMALFIVLWIVGQNKAVKGAISEYFKDPVAFAEKTKAGGGSGILPDSAPPAPKADQPPVILMTKDQNKDMKQLEEEKKKIEEIIRNTPAFDKFKGQIEVTLTDEGLRIELVDNSSGLFFDVGSARLKKETVQLLAMVAAEVGKLPNRVIVEGYTDARPYVTENYSNWELSVDRANVARKILAENGLRKGQVQEVRGFADQRLRRPEDPMDFSNRRVGILVAALPVKTPSLQDSFAKKPGR
jgi:chemotaxis protein MotB